jgi:hypothetical protein
VASVAQKSFDNPDETRSFTNGAYDVLNLGEVTVSRARLQPGWRWSEHIKPVAGGDSCQFRHVGYLMSGTLGIRTDDGTERTIHGGEAYVVPPGHDGWVVGDEPVVAFEFETKAAQEFARPTSG